MTDDSHIAQLSQQAESCLDKGDLTQARRLYAEICRSRDDDSHVWLMYGAINGELGNIEVARGALERAIALDPSNAEAHLALAHLLKSTQKSAEALAAAQRAAEADTSFVEAWLFVAALAGQQKDWTLAEGAANKAVSLDPGRSEGHVNLGNVFLATGRPQEAEASFRKSLALGETAEAWFGLGTALAALGRQADAEPALTAALRLDTANPIFREALANCLDQLGRSVESATTRSGLGPA